jgi:hypothetical protein
VGWRARWRRSVAIRVVSTVRRRRRCVDSRAGLFAGLDELGRGMRQRGAIFAGRRGCRCSRLIVGIFKKQKTI